MNSRRVQRQFSESAFVRVLWLVALALAFLPLAANARSLFIPRRVVVTILKDSLAIGDSIAATAITYGPQGTPTADGTMAWSTAPVGCATIWAPAGTSARSVIAKGKVAGKCVVMGTWREYGAAGKDSLRVYPKPTPPDTTPIPIPPDTTTPPTPAPSGSTVNLINGSLAGCLKASTPISVTTAAACSKADSTQTFVVPTATVAGPIGVLAKCLAANGTVVSVASCSGLVGQQWKRTGYTSTYVHVQSGMCLAGITSTRTVTLAPCTTDAFNSWTAEPTSTSNPVPGGPAPPAASTCTAGDSAVATKPHPNQPAGMTTLYTHAGLQVTPCGWFGAVGQISIVADAEKGDVLQFAMKGTTTPGSGTARIDTYPEISSFGASRIYIAFWEKISVGFKGNDGAGSLKNAIVHTASSYSGLPNGAFHLPGLFNNPANADSRIRPAVSFVNYLAHDGITMASVNNILYYLPDQGEAGDPGDIFSRGTWHFIEALCDFAAKGQANGSFKVWIDGRLVVPTLTPTDLYANGLAGTGLRPLYDGLLRFTGLELTNVWGGGGTVMAVDQYYRFKDIYVSGGFARTGERPDHWNIIAHEGTTVTAGSQVHVTARLVDANGNSVDICGLQPSLSISNGALWAYWDGTPVYAAYMGCEHGQQLYVITAGAAAGISHVITVEDYATVMNGQRGEKRVGTLTITTK